MPDSARNKRILSNIWAFAYALRKKTRSAVYGNLAASMGKG